MKVVSIRLSKNDEERQERIFEYYGIQGETFTDRFRNFLKTCADNLANYEVAKKTELAQERGEPIYCKIRFQVMTPEGIKFFCCQKPPKAIPLISLKVCEVCKALQYNLKLTEATLQPKPKATEPETEPAPAPSQPAPDQKPMLPYPTIEGLNEYAFKPRTDGSKLCPFKSNSQYGVGWRWVFPLDCKKCKRETPDKQAACAKLFYQLKAMPLTPKRH